MLSTAEAVELSKAGVQVRLQPSGRVVTIARVQKDKALCYFGGERSNMEWFSLSKLKRSPTMEALKDDHAKLGSSSSRTAGDVLDKAMRASPSGTGQQLFPAAAEVPPVTATSPAAEVGVDDQVLAAMDALKIAAMTLKQAEAELSDAHGALLGAKQEAARIVKDAELLVKSKQSDIDTARRMAHEAKEHLTKILGV